MQGKHGADGVSGGGGQASFHFKRTSARAGESGTDRDSPSLTVQADGYTPKRGFAGFADSPSDTSLMPWVIGGVAAFIGYKMLRKKRGARGAGGSARR